MAVSTRTIRVRRIVGALVLAGVFISGAYLLSNPEILAPSTANAQSTQALLAAYAQKKGPDGLPLWEDQLISTASSTAWATTTPVEDTTPAPGITPAPDSLTDQFAQSLFSQYMNQEGGANPSDQDIDTFAQSAVQSLVQSHAQQNVYTEANISVAGTGSAALKSYAALVSQAVNANVLPTDGTKNELDYFSDAVEKNQVDELKTVAAIGAGYSSLAPALIAIPVPSEAQQAHLEMANAFARLGADITDMSMLETDPLRAYLGLSAYQTDDASLLQSFSDMAQVFSSDQVVLTPQESGYDFYNTAVRSVGLNAGSSSAE
jgi:hypothetical protein